MQIDRNAGYAPRTEKLAREVAQLRGPCVGCKECRGLCAALIEALILPDLLLART